jgi:hypothetical protein
MQGNTNAKPGLDVKLIPTGCVGICYTCSYSSASLGARRVPLFARVASLLPTMLLALASRI